MEIPKMFMGRKREPGAIERVLSATPKDPAPDNSGEKRTPATINDAQNYIILEAKAHGVYNYPDLLVSKGRSYLNKNWDECNVELRKENAYMSTIRQFADFLTLLKSGNAFDGKGNKVDSKELERIFLDITKVASPYRAEWLDAKFVDLSGDLGISYHKINQNGSLTSVTENLDGALMNDKTPGIDFGNWLQTADYHGLPTSKTKNGTLWYWNPRINQVAGFIADSGRAFLYCGRDPSGTDAGLGVRVVRKKI